jgi:hypothetical protein
MAGMPWGRVNYQTGRFVYDQDVLILINHGERNWLG